MRKRIFTIIIIILSCFSIITLKGTDLLTKQLIWYILGFIIMFKLDNRIINYIRPLYIITNILLLYLLIFGTTINGSKAWINIFSFSFQPSEFMKIILIIYLSKIAITNEKYIFKLSLITLIPSILTFLEPDTGNVIFYLVILMSIIFYREKNTKKIIKPIILLSIIGFIFACLYIFNNRIFISIFGNSFFYRMDRIIELFNNTGYQLNRALISIGSSGLFGCTNLISIPESNTDFAFSLLISKIGLIGILIYLLVSFIFDNYLIRLIRKSSGISSCIIFSFTTMKIIQSSIHELMNIGLFPITGIPLPFISYGGSSLICYFIMIGIISNTLDNLDQENYLVLDSLQQV